MNIETIIKKRLQTLGEWVFQRPTLRPLTDWLYHFSLEREVALRRSVNLLDERLDGIDHGVATAQTASGETRDELVRRAARLHRWLGLYNWVIRRYAERKVPANTAAKQARRVA